MCRSYGYDVYNRKFLTEQGMGYRNYDIRLRKMGQSLLLFGEKELLDSLNEFVKVLEKKGQKFDKKSAKRYSEVSHWPFS